MTQALSNPLTFEAFLAWYPDDGGRYELIEGLSGAGGDAVYRKTQAAHHFGVSTG